MPPAVVSTRREWVLNLLRRDILSGRLAPGARLRQQDIAARYGASVIPVREALVELSGQGLVSLRPHHGAVIAQLQAADIEDIYDLRAEIEPFAVRLSVPGLDDSSIARMRTVLTTMRTRRRKDAEWAALNQEFHEITVSHVQRPLLLRMLRMLRTAVQFQAVQLRSFGDHRRGDHEHQLIFDACVKRNGIAAARHTRRHILNTKVRLLAVQRAQRASKSDERRRDDIRLEDARMKSALGGR